MYRKKSKRFIGMLLICLCSVYILAMLKKYDVFFPSSINKLNLTTEQKLDDFDQLYHMILTSFPNLEELEKAYSIDFEGRYERYKSMIEETEDDFEFYCVMSGIVSDLGSFHTDLCFPDKANLRNMNCYNAENVVENKKFQAYMDYWYELIGEQCKEKADVNIAEFRYLDGKYFLDTYWSDSCYDIYKNYYLVSLDGMDVDEFVTENISIYRNQYDSNYDKAYRRIITLNESEGKRVDVKLQNEQGDVLETELCMSIEMEIVNGYYPNYIEGESESDYYNIYHHYSQTEDILYVQINDFSNNAGSELKKIFSQAGERTQIIIDLRNNYGGNPYYAKEHIYPYLYSEDITFERNFLMPISEYNAEQNNRIANKLLYKTKKLEQGVLYENKVEYKGKNHDFSDNVYYIVGGKTGSAADGYISMIKENELGTIVGMDTGGEGFGSSYFLYSLENSNLPIVYFPAEPFEAEGLNNAVYGTMPDIYLYQSAESYYTQCEMKEEGINTDQYENRLKWDNVLVETIGLRK